MVQNLFKVIPFTHCWIRETERQVSVVSTIRELTEDKGRVGTGHSRPLIPQWEKAQPPRVIQGCPRLTLTVAMPPFGPLRIWAVLSWALKGE